MRRIGTASIAAFAILFLAPHAVFAASNILTQIINPGGACDCTGSDLSHIAPDWGCVLQTFSIVFNDFFVLATLIIVLFIAYAGFQMILSPTNAELRTKARKRLINAIIGLAIVLSAYLLVNTLMSTLYNGKTPWNLLLSAQGSSNCIVERNPNTLPGIDITSNASGLGTPTSPGGVQPTGTPPAPGQVQQAVCSAMSAYRGQSTAAGPDGGNKACAWAVNNVLSNAGISPIGANPTNVNSVETALKSGRGTLINQSQAQCGDLVVQANDGHIGICMNTGCTQVLSNSSSHATFTWVSNTSFSPSYNGGPGRIYRINS